MPGVLRRRAVELTTAGLLAAVLSLSAVVIYGSWTDGPLPAVAALIAVYFVLLCCLGMAGLAWLAKYLNARNYDRDMAAEQRRAVLEHPTVPLSITPPRGRVEIVDHTANMDRALRDFAAGAWTADTPEGP